MKNSNATGCLEIIVMNLVILGICLSAMEISEWIDLPVVVERIMGIIAFVLIFAIVHFLSQACDALRSEEYASEQIQKWQSLYIEACKTNEEWVKENEALKKELEELKGNRETEQD